VGFAHILRANNVRTYAQCANPSTGWPEK
jgi:hypothetical protein